MSIFDEQGFGGQEYPGSAESHYIDTPEQVDLRYNVAGIGSRFVALLLDHLIQGAAVIVEIFAFVFLASLSASSGDHGSTHSTGGDGGMTTGVKWFIALVILANFTFFVGYYTLFEAFWKGQTPGKRAMKLRVIKDSGRQITFFEALARNLMRIVDNLPGMYLAGLITMVCNKANKRLGDFVAGTLVVHERMDEQSLLIQPTSMFHDWSTPANQPLDPWRTTTPALFPDDAIAKLNAQDLVIIEAFFARALDLTVEMRAMMAARIAQQMAAKMGVALPEGNPERALESIAYAMRGSGFTGR